MHGRQRLGYWLGLRRGGAQHVTGECGGERTLYQDAEFFRTGRGDLVGGILAAVGQHDDRKPPLGADFHIGMGAACRELAHQRADAGGQGAGLATRAKGAEGNGALEHRDAGGVGQGLHHVVGAAQANGGYGGVEAVVFARGLAGLARDGAGDTGLKHQAHAVGTGVLGRVGVRLNVQAGRGPHADEAVVDHAGVYVAVCAGEQAVAYEQGLAFGDGGGGAVALEPGVANLKGDGANRGCFLRAYQRHATEHEDDGANELPNDGFMHGLSFFSVDFLSLSNWRCLRRASKPVAQFPCVTEVALVGLAP